MLRVIRKDGALASPERSGRRFVALPFLGGSQAQRVNWIEVDAHGPW